MINYRNENMDILEDHIKQNKGVSPVMEAIVVRLSDVDNFNDDITISTDAIKVEYETLGEFISDINKLQIYDSTCIVDHSVFDPCKEAYRLNLDIDNGSHIRWLGEDMITANIANDGESICIFVFYRLDNKIYPLSIKGLIFQPLKEGDSVRLVYRIDKIPYRSDMSDFV